MAQHLLVAADRFQLSRLRRICERRLCETVEVTSCSLLYSMLETLSPYADSSNVTHAVQKYGLAYCYCRAGLMQNQHGWMSAMALPLSEEEHCAAECPIDMAET